MNTIKFFRLQMDGSVQTAYVRCTQPQTRGYHKGYVRRLPVVRQAEDMMLRRGWTRHRLKATKRLTMGDAVRRGLQTLAA